MKRLIPVFGIWYILTISGPLAPPTPGFGSERTCVANGFNLYKLNVIGMGTTLACIDAQDPQNEIILEVPYEG
jgi:hypothetical protein